MKILKLVNLINRLSKESTSQSVVDEIFQKGRVIGFPVYSVYILMQTSLLAKSKSKFPLGNGGWMIYDTSETEESIIIKKKVKNHVEKTALKSVVAAYRIKILIKKVRILLSIGLKSSILLFIIVCFIGVIFWIVISLIGVLTSL